MTCAMDDLVDGVCKHATCGCPGSRNGGCCEAHTVMTPASTPSGKGSQRPGDPS